jgi:hypothetical protein
MFYFLLAGIQQKHDLGKFKAFLIITLPLILLFTLVLIVLGLLQLQIR